MKLSRRSFLKGLAATPIVVALPLPRPIPPPGVYGKGPATAALEDQRAINALCKGAIGEYQGFEFIRATGPYEGFLPNLGCRWKAVWSQRPDKFRYVQVCVSVEVPYRERGLRRRRRSMLFQMANLFDAVEPHHVKLEPGGVNHWPQIAVLHVEGSVRRALRAEGIEPWQVLTAGTRSVS